MMFALAAPLLAWASSTPSMYGVSMKSSLVTIDMTSGKMTELGTEHSEELEAQELSAIDAKRGRYYTMGVDTTNQTNTVVMVVWNLADGKISKKVALPFAGEPFVGIGEAIDVDPTDGTIIVMGTTAARSGHPRCTRSTRPRTADLVADLGGSMKADGMGTTTTYDYDEKVVYLVTAVMNNSATPPAPYFKHSAVSIKDGSVDDLPTPHHAGRGVRLEDERVYGTAVAAGPGGGGAWAARVDPRTKRAPLGGGKAERRLSYFETSTRDKLVSVGDKYSLTMSIGDLHAFDASRRVHYTLLMDNVNATPYRPTDYCKAHGAPCATNSSCCCGPTAAAPPAAAIAGHAAACADPYGYCFAVDDCSQMIAGGADPLAVAAYLYGVELETGKLFGKKVPLCSMEPGPKTNPQQCPWSIELA